MPNLYEINADLQAAIELAEQALELDPEDGKWLFDVISGLNLDRDAKLEAIGKFYKNEAAIAEMIGAEIFTLQTRARTHKNKAAWLKSWAAMNMVPGEKREFSACSYAWKASESLEIFDASRLPDSFCKIERTPMKKELKEAIKAGVISIDESVGKIIKKNNLSIK
jgi:hypothetical protein